MDLIVHEERMHDGSRKVTRITEVQGMEGDVIILQDLFQFQQTGIEGRRITGRHTPLGIRPKFLAKLESKNVHLPPSAFTAETVR
jgi:pilus assembly protein CpaF